MNAPKLSLYDIGVEALQIEDLLIAGEGELTPELEERWNALLTGGKDKINAAACVVKSLEANAEACKLEAQRLTQRAQAFASDADRLKDRIKVAVDLAFNGKVKTDLFTVWCQTSAATTAYELLPGVSIFNFRREYPEYSRVTVELDKAALKEAQKHGEPLPTQIVATEREGTRFVRIK